MKKKSSWPYIIIGAIILNIIAAIYTVYLSLDYPADNDESFFMPYQDVERNYEELKQKAANFDKYYNLQITNPSTKLKVNYKKAYIVDDSLNITLQNLKTSNDDIKIKAKLTRPHTKKEDTNLNLELKNNSIILNTKELAEGRWNLLLQLSLNDDTSKFYKIEFCKKQCSSNK